MVDARGKARKDQLEWLTRGEAGSAPNCKTKGECVWKSWEKGQKKLVGVGRAQRKHICIRSQNQGRTCVEELKKDQKRLIRAAHTWRSRISASIAKPEKWRCGWSKNRFEAANCAVICPWRGEFVRLKRKRHWICWSCARSTPKVGRRDTHGRRRRLRWPNRTKGILEQFWCDFHKICVRSEPADSFCGDSPWNCGWMWRLAAALVVHALWRRSPEFGA